MSGDEIGDAKRLFQGVKRLKQEGGHTGRDQCGDMRSVILANRLL